MTSSDAPAAAFPDTGSTPTRSTPAGMPRQHLLVIWLILASAFVVMLNETIISVALPRMTEELGVDPAVGQWLLTAFMLTMAVVIPMTGFFMRRLPTRVVFIGAMSFFTVGTVVAALAPDFGVLVVARVIQAIGTGVMSPLLMTTIMTLVPPHMHGKMMGNISIVMAAAPALGPLIGGAIVNSMSWRAIFVFVIPVALVALVLGIVKLTNVNEPERVRIDLLSVLLAAIAFGGLVYGLSEFGTEAQARLTPGAADAVLPPWIPLMIGGVFLVVFVFRQLHLQKTDNALVDLRIFNFRNFSIATLYMIVLCFILFGSLVLLPFYIQGGLQLDPLQSALIVLPGGILMGFAGPFVGAWYDKVGPRPLLVAGSSIAVVALVLMAFLFRADTPWWAVSLCYFVLCAGLALQFAPMFTASLGSLTPKYMSYGSAAIGTVQQLAGAAGTSLFIVLFTLSAVDVLADGGDTVDSIVAGTQSAFAFGAAASIVVVVLAFFIRRPESESAGMPAMH